jgi:hypothetical protein
VLFLSPKSVFLLAVLSNSSAVLVLAMIRWYYQIFTPSTEIARIARNQTTPICRFLFATLIILDGLHRRPRIAAGDGHLTAETADFNQPRGREVNVSPPFIYLFYLFYFILRSDRDIRESILMRPFSEQLLLFSRKQMPAFDVRNSASQEV